MSNLAWLLCALIAFAYAYRWSGNELEKDVFNEPPPPVAPRRERDRKTRRQVSSSASLNKNTRDEAIGLVQERLLATRPAPIVPPSVASPSVVSPSVVSPSVVSPPVVSPSPEPSHKPTTEPEPEPKPEHENDQVRREMGIARPAPPHLAMRSSDMRNNDMRHVDMRNRTPYAATTPQARNNARRPTRRSNDKPAEQHHCSSCNRTYNDLYSFDQHNILRHPEAPRNPTSAEDNIELSVPVATSCETCLRVFDTPLSLLQHNAACHPVLWAAGCYQCGIPRFKTGEDAKIHYRRVHPGRNLPPATTTTAPHATSQTSQRSINPTLRDTVLTAEPDPTLPVLQQTYGCDIAHCKERFSTAEERDAHRAAPFPHGDETSLAAAFPPLSVSPSSHSSATSTKPSTTKDTPGPSPPPYAHVGEDSSSLGSLSLDLGEDDGKEFSSLHWALSSNPSLSLSPTNVEINDPIEVTPVVPIFEINDPIGPLLEINDPVEPALVINDPDEVPQREPLVITDEDWVTPWINDPPIPEVTFPVVHHWQETNPADIPLPDSPIFDADPAVALDHPLPSFSISPDTNDEIVASEHPAPADLIRHVWVGHGNPDGSESVTVPSPFRFGEIIPDPVPPGMEAFPELPSRPEAATTRAQPEVAPIPVHSRWHTDEVADFAIPDMSPKSDTKKSLSRFSPKSDVSHELHPDSSRHDSEPEAGSASPEQKLSRWDSAESPKKGLSRWASASSGDSPKAETASRWAEEESPREISVPLPESEPATVSDSWDSEKDKDTQRWSEEVDDEYADEIPGVFIGASAPVTGTNNIPLGRSRMFTPPSGPAFPPPAPVVHQSRYAPAPTSISRPSSQIGHAPDRARAMPSSLPPTSHYTPPPPMPYSGGYNGTQQSNGGYQSNGMSRPHSQPQHYANGGYSGGYTSNGSYSQPPVRSHVQARAPEPIYLTTTHVEEQVPNFAYQTDNNFNAFAVPSSAVDTLGPLPAPPHAPPSEWTGSIHSGNAPISLSHSPSPSPPPVSGLSFNASRGPISPGAYKSGTSDVSETSSGGGPRFGSHFGGAIGPTSAPVQHPGPGTRGRWADRVGAPQQQQQQQQLAPTPRSQPPPPKFDASSGWSTSIPTPAPKRSYGGKPIVETISEKEQRRRQAEVDKMLHIAASEEEGFGGW